MINNTNEGRENESPPPSKTPATVSLATLLNHCLRNLNICYIHLSMNSPFTRNKNSFQLANNIKEFIVLHPFSFVLFSNLLILLFSSHEYFMVLNSSIRSQIL